MSTEVLWEGGFSGKPRQGIIHWRMFGLLSDVGEAIDDEDVFNWLSDEIGWAALSIDEECIFASLAKALPNANYNYETSFDYEGGGLDQMFHTIAYADGKLSLSTLHRFEASDEDDEDNEDEEADDWDEDYRCHVREIVTELSCLIDKEGRIIKDEKLSQECLKLEKERLAEIVDLIDAGTDDPAELIDLGMLYETGLAGVDRDLTAAWDCYLKAARTEDEEAVEFVKEIFTDESKDELRELLAQKCISKDSSPVFFNLAMEENNTELTAMLLVYKDSLE